MRSFPLIGAALAALFLGCGLNGGLTQAAELHLYAGAGLQPAVATVIAKFEQDTGNHVVVEYGGSGQIMTRYQLTGQGDLFLAGSAFDINKLQQKGKVTAAYPLALHIPVLVLRRDKAQGINNYADLAASHLRLAMGDPKAIALGRSGERLLDATGYGTQLRAKVVVRTADMPQLVLYVLQGNVDGAVVGRSDAVKHLDVLKVLPSPNNVPAEVVTLAQLTTSQNVPLTKQLAGYFTSPQGIKAFADQGFLPIGRGVKLNP
ncbi:molybdate ABC transporter substrate-binding protein [Sodalis sp. dw_96]|uniref:molybdate ABC transporter substrate-binding protein n=1 Tax=Sodalis sp. dw_96 TaxID=2719794 RepID=UPI001BD2D6C4|nr:molybdate ABC transporter substrate-binding protein [Sodalis sp. dw_96]